MVLHLPEVTSYRPHFDDGRSHSLLKRSEDPSAHIRALEPGVQPGVLVPGGFGC